MVRRSHHRIHCRSSIKMSKSYILAADLPTEYHAVWRSELIRSMKASEGKSKGLAISEMRIYHMRVYDDDEKKFLEKLKTYNNMDHDGGNHRAWHPNWNILVRLIRRCIGLGNIPLTPSHPINTPGHVLLLCRKNDKKSDGREMR